MQEFNDEELRYAQVWGEALHHQLERFWGWLVLRASGSESRGGHETANNHFGWLSHLDILSLDSSFIWLIYCVS